MPWICYDRSIRSCCIIPWTRATLPVKPDITLPFQSPSPFTPKETTAVLPFFCQQSRNTRDTTAKLEKEAVEPRKDLCYLLFIFSLMTLPGIALPCRKDTRCYQLGARIYPAQSTGYLGELRYSLNQKRMDELTICWHGNFPWVL